MFRIGSASSSRRATRDNTGNHRAETGWQTPHVRSRFRREWARCEWSRGCRRTQTQCLQPRRENECLPGPQYVCVTNETRHLDPQAPPLSPRWTEALRLGRLLSGEDSPLAVPRQRELLRWRQGISKATPTDHDGAANGIPTDCTPYYSPKRLNIRCWCYGGLE